MGLDFGSDSVRALIVDCADGRELATAVAAYPRWRDGAYCDPARHQFRQHPLDHLETMRSVVRRALKALPKAFAGRVVGIGVDTTGSTPIAVDRHGEALALKPAFADNPNAMFVLWKDHTAVDEADEFNELCQGGSGPDYTRYVGGTYSCEWFWAKIAHVVRHDHRVARAAYSWVEHCDWIPAVLTGCTDPLTMVRSRCAAGHKACWHPEFGGLPDVDFLCALEPRLSGLRERLYTDCVPCDHPAGRLTPAWAKALGLTAGIPVAAGAFDAHLGAVGAGAGPYDLAKVMGTSTCDMLVAPEKDIGDRCIQGICGQVDGSIIPGLVGLEAGQSAFGDAYAWFRRLLGWGVARGLGGGQATNQRRLHSFDEELLPALEAEAVRIKPGATGALALDWFNGRRTPDADQRVRGAIAGLHLGTDAPAIYRAIIEATAYGARAIMDCFTEQGVAVKQILALGGIAKKSPLVMQICADVLDRKIRVVGSEQCCALGAAMSGAVVAGVYRDIRAAQRAMHSPVVAEYRPQVASSRTYSRLYQAYRHLGRGEEARVRRGW